MCSPRLFARELTGKECQQLTDAVRHGQSAEDLLCPRADANLPVLPQVRRLVRCRPVQSHTLPARLISHVRIVTISPGRAPVSS